MSGVVKIDIVETEETLKALLLKAKKVEEKEKVQVLYWLKTKTVDSVSAIAVFLGRHRTTVQRWLTSYRQEGLVVLTDHPVADDSTRRSDAALLTTRSHPQRSLDCLYRTHR